MTLGGWVDLYTPAMKHMRGLVVKASEVLDRGHKIAVHCHAGYGRTGVLIACILVYREVLEAEDAIRIVRKRRLKCIQNRLQSNFVRAFAAIVVPSPVFSHSLTRPQHPLGPVMSRDQRWVSCQTKVALRFCQ